MSEVSGFGAVRVAAAITVACIAAPATALSVVVGDLNQDGYTYSLEASAPRIPGSSDNPTARASVEPGLVTAETTFTCNDIPYPYYCGSVLPLAQARLRYQIEATATQAFYDATGLSDIDIPLIYNWSIELSTFGVGGRRRRICHLWPSQHCL